MRDAYPLPPNQDGLARTGLACQCCGTLIVLSVEGLFVWPSRGSNRRFCTPACRQAAYRRRQADAPEDTPAQHHGGRGRHLSPPPDHPINTRPSTTTTLLEEDEDYDDL